MSKINAKKKDFSLKATYFYLPETYNLFDLKE